MHSPSFSSVKSAPAGEKVAPTRCWTLWNEICTVGTVSPRRWLLVPSSGFSSAAAGLKPMLTCETLLVVSSQIWYQWAATASPPDIVRRFHVPQGGEILMRKQLPCLLLFRLMSIVVKGEQTEVSKLIYRGILQNNFTKSFQGFGGHSWALLVWCTITDPISPTPQGHNSWSKLLNRETVQNTSHGIHPLGGCHHHPLPQTHWMSMQKRLVVECCIHRHKSLNGFGKCHQFRELKCSWNIN